jgi:hypothetical protein
MRSRWTLLILSSLLTLLLLAGCGSRRGGDPTPTPTKTPAGQSAAVATPVPPSVDANTQAAQQTQAAQPVPVVDATLAQPAEVATEPTPEPYSVATVNTDLLNIRSDHDANAEVVRTANRGETFDVLGKNAASSWANLGQNGEVVGWAAVEYLTIVDPVKPPEPVVAEPAAPVGPTPVLGFQPATMTSPDLGAQAFLWWRAEIADRDLDLLRDAGFNWVKQSFAWETIEGAGRGVYDWSVADRVVTHVNQKGLKLLARLSIDPDEASFWAGPPPGNADAFAEYAGAVAQRYNCAPGAIGCIQAFQIWNEPNLAREWGGNPPNPAEYAAFLGKAYAAIKAVNPNAIVISAGMAPTGDNSAIAMADDIFYDQMYQAMGGQSNGYFDALGVHGAGFAAPPELDPAEAAANKEKYGGYRFFAFRHVEDIRAIMVKYGDTAKQIVLLEFGWTFDRVNPSYKWHGADAGIDEYVQADYLKRAYQFAAANWQPWIGLMSLITMPNLDWLEDGNAQDEEQYWWAIMEPSPIDQKYWRPAYIVLCIYFQEELKGNVCVHNPNQ